ncbi:2-oxoacid:acceptor oxidoreductase family protein [Chakrabartyella piscis]|uniref:2-oxoacid:acceptor oxidoreductase family protein n=1 Tax=Chakrabartyella piscis TaxID=2918914 RepID=UPI002958A339|nr:2-oxoacid:acceptor oxidoreductase family protein [Chakrabartyella piscis]
MEKIRWHGRGGNGAFSAAKILGYAVSVHGNKYAQAFPSFGPERRGAPVLGFTRISDTVINDHSQINMCHCVVVLDETLQGEVDFTEGIEDGGTLLINTTKTSEAIKEELQIRDAVNVVAVDATKLAMEVLGRNIVNTALMGAAIAVNEMCAISDVEKALDDMMSPKLAEKNKRLIRMAYEQVKGDLA